MKGTLNLEIGSIKDPSEVDLTLVSGHISMSMLNRLGCCLWWAGSKLVQSVHILNLVTWFWSRLKLEFILRVSASKQQCFSSCQTQQQQRRSNCQKSPRQSRWLAYCAASPDCDPQYFGSFSPTVFSDFHFEGPALLPVGSLVWFNPHLQPAVLERTSATCDIWFNFSCSLSAPIL